MLESRGHERRSRRAPIGLLGYRSHDKGLTLKPPSQVRDRRLVHQREPRALQLPRLGEVPPGGYRHATNANERGGEPPALGVSNPARCCHLEGALEVPPVCRAKTHARAFTLDDHPRRDALDAPRREPRHDLLPQHRRDLVAVETVKDSAGFLGVYQPLVELAPVLHRACDGSGGDLVEHHALYRHSGGENLGEVPGDGLPLAVLVRGQVQLARSL